VYDRRVLVLTRLIAGKVDPSEAALLLGLSPRSIRRLRSGYLERGPASLAHGNTGRRPAHALDPRIAARVVQLAKTTYAGCNDSHLAELLAEREGITLSRVLVRRILRGAGMQKPAPHRPRGTSCGKAALFRPPRELAEVPRRFCPAPEGGRRVQLLLCTGTVLRTQQELRSLDAEQCDHDPGLESVPLADGTGR
jgi:transposase